MYFFLFPIFIAAFYYGLARGYTTDDNEPDSAEILQFPHKRGRG